MSDWDATYDAVGAINGGLDLEMPSGKFLNREKLLPAIKSGKVSEDTINDAVRRIIRTELEFHWPDREQRDLSIPRFNQEGSEVALQAAREGIVLLKNDSNALPLSKDKIKTIAVIGPDAYPAVPVGGGSAQVAPFQAINFLDGLSDSLAGHALVTSDHGIMSPGVAAIATNFETNAQDGKEGITEEDFNNENFSGSPERRRVTKHVSLGEPFELGLINLDEIDVSALQNEQGSAERWTGYYVPKAAGAFDVFAQQGGFSGSGCRMYVD
jgi:beta-glucosidase